MVTGAGRGQGRAQALALARAGADVVICDLGRDLPSIPYQLARPEELAITAAEVAAQGRRCLSFEADVRDADQMASVVKRAQAELGGIDVVCANAGVISLGTAWELSEQQWDEVVDTILKGSWLTCRAAIPAMLGRPDGGCIVLVASAASLKGYPGMAHYVAAKHGLIGLMRALAIELAPHGIRVNCVAPGAVRTAMGLNPALQAFLATAPEAASSLRALLPVDLLEPEDVSQAVVWLATSGARFVTGAVVPVDGGMVLR